jgi:pectate lyase
MRSHRLHALFAIGVLLSACTLTSDEFHPLPAESTPSKQPYAAMPAPGGCGSSCAPPEDTPTAPPAAEPAAGSGGELTPGAAIPRAEPSAPGAAAPPANTPPPASAPPASNTPPSAAAPGPVTPPAPEPEPSPPAPPSPPPPPSSPEPTPPDPVIPPAPSPDLTLVGWAAVDGLGTPTTTGGAAGATVIATTPEELADFATRVEPLTILIAGTLRLERVDVTSDKTLRGIGAAPTLEGGLRIRGRADDFVRNVIIQNLIIDAAFSDVEGDGVQIHYAHHVWVDHCDVRNAEDGNLDIVHGSDFITVSFSRFSYSEDADGDRLSMQIGHSDAGAAEDTGHLRVTLHHDFWDAGIVGSMPSARFGDVHVFNNYYASPGAETAITADFASRLLVEGNYFESVPAPFRIAGGSAPEPQLRAVDNVVTAPSPQLDAAGPAFIPPYPYTPDAAQIVPERVRSSAGATLQLTAPNP